MGANSLVEYDGSILAANQDVIVVSLNYRTNGECSSANQIVIVIVHC